ncbi:hypothetical protein VLK31_28030 [Variovorax sp. H27-G14]|uniref:hypothetical protein n=1 Tax=Variovorax sp. H27-G14 TaxID=3111914 RepID=UPI0038FC2872
MDRQASLLGHDFSQWSQLTERYAQEVEGLRRHEPGASMRLMRIAHAMKHQHDPLRAGMPDSEHMALPAHLVPPRPRGPTWRGRVRKTLFKLRAHFSARGTQDGHRGPEGAAPPMA